MASRKAFGNWKYSKNTINKSTSTFHSTSIACSLELNIQNQKRFGTAKKQTFSSFFLRNHFGHKLLTKQRHGCKFWYLYNKRGQFDPYPGGGNLPPFWTDFATTFWAPCAHRVPLVSIEHGETRKYLLVNLGQVWMQCDKTHTFWQNPWTT